MPPSRTGPCLSRRDKERQNVDLVNGDRCPLVVVGVGRGIVVGDVLRRLVGRTMAKQVTQEVEAATSPFPYALSTRFGCECVAHVLQTLTELDEDATIVSVDGIGAYDLISRKAMLDGLLSVEGGQQLLPFVRSFYGAPSTYLWEDEMGTNHRILQGEGGEQGDPLMPLLFSLQPLEQISG